MTAVDNQNVSASPVDVDIILCSGCNSHGDCNYNITRSSTSSMFKLASCVCYTGYDGNFNNKKNVIMVIKNIPNEMESRWMTFNIFQVMIVKMTQTLVLKTRALWVETVPTWPHKKRSPWVGDTIAQTVRQGSQTSITSAKVRVLTMLSKQPCLPWRQFWIYTMYMRRTRYQKEKKPFRTFVQLKMNRKHKVI